MTSTGDPPKLRVLHLALIASLLGPAAASAQTTADQMLAMARQIRASAEQLKDSLPAADRAQMIKQAEEIERAVKNGDYGGAVAPRKEPTLEETLMAEYGRLDWLAKDAACAGYTQENFFTFRYQAAINDRDSHCRNAYGHWAAYLRILRNGEGAELAAQSLFYYDAAARRAAGLPRREVR